MGMPDAEGPGPTDGLPDLPAEWGRVVVPDDPSALAAETALVRRELRGQARRRRWQRRLGGSGHRMLGLPVLILLVVALITTGALLAGTWPRPSRGGDRPTVVPYPTPPTGLAGRSLPALDLVDAEQSPVSLRGLLPAVIILVDTCECADQVAEAVAAAPPEVSVVPVTGDRTGPPTTAPPVRPLADPAGGLRAFLRLPGRPGSATVLLVDRSGTLLRVVAEVRTVEDYRSDLAALTR
ncbi:MULTISPECIES: hypothetical protein [Micromonospora]|uniref:Thioredoxin domain-containing protein n=1 Tax=Micromonospora yangpuensis TaxID=683228 RepID=A0A1C6VEU9_9ACTN|nr:hypothetical protein [Micromonospora yangpuensis]GGM30332.1 hypothetical protein GCM10012279_56570 [Micromonospora yangpuensis]SCL64785.1 hypothetical protein GA0070617_5565 [Micromonospora yangpuensis]